jgi:hypothetical protein
LQGVSSNNANRAVIAINPNGSLSPNVTSIDGLAFYAQVLVQNVNPAGPVNLIGITVDGAGDNAGCGMSSATLAGIFYASSTSGTVNEVTARNQTNGGCGWGIWVENGDSTSQTITIANSSVHNTGAGGGGISASTLSPPTLTATISGNFVSNPGHLGIQDSANGAIMQNIVTNAGSSSIFAIDDSLMVSANTVADTLGIGIEVEFAGAVQSNKLSNVGDSIALVPDTLATIKANTIMNTFCGIDFSGGTNSGTITGNVLNDSLTGFADWFGQTITSNTLDNLDMVQSTSATCP